MSSDIVSWCALIKAKESNQATDKFVEETDWLHWDYDNPYNLNHIKDEMMREPNERVYLEIHPNDEPIPFAIADGESRVRR